MSDVLFVCDSGAAVGGGHVMRCLTLAEALAEEGLRSTFLAPPAVGTLLDRFDRSGCGRVPLDADPDADALASAAADAAAGFRAAVFDHFGMDAAQEAPLRRPGLVLAAVDDLADRPHAADLLVDPNLHRTAADYARLVPPGAELLLGPEYALVRSEFAVARERVARQPREAVRRVLVSLGLTDVGGITERALAVVAPLLGSAEADIVTGAAAPSLPRLRELAARDPRLHLHVETSSMAALMTSADLALGAGGSSTWERACLGLPTLTVVIADNQAPGTRALEQAGATVSLDARVENLEAAAEPFRRLMTDAELRARLSRASAALCDGGGARRVAARLRVRLVSPTGR